jgi:hypothetical protein
MLMREKIRQSDELAAAFITDPNTPRTSGYFARRARNPLARKRRRNPQGSDIEMQDSDEDEEAAPSEPIEQTPPAVRKKPGRPPKASKK